MLLRSYLILFAICLSACGTSAPPAPVVEECALMSVDGVDAYLYCLRSDGSGEPWRVKLKDANKYICTTPAGFVAGKKYQKELIRYINKECK